MGEKRTTSDGREENIAIESQAADKRAREIDFGNTSPGKNARSRRRMKPLRNYIQRNNNEIITCHYDSRSQDY